jgi:PAS domain S-box-containing protein
MLNSRYPMFIWWGPELTNLYNDAYIPVLGARHPVGLGRSAPALWSDIWSVVGPQADAVLTEGRATWNEELLLLMERNRFLEETYFTFSYSPVPDDAGGVGGVFCACTEDTPRVLGRRRLRTLRLLAERAAEARTARGACEAAATTLAENRHDLPFALIYLLDSTGRRATLAGAMGLAEGGPASPLDIALDDPRAAWPFRQAAEVGGLVAVAGLGGRFGTMPGGAWPESARDAIVADGQPGTGDARGLCRRGHQPAAGVQARVGSSLALARARREAEASEARYRAIVEGQAEMVCRFRPDGTILFANGAYARALGTTPDALAGVDFWDFVVKDDQASVRRMLDELSPEAPAVRIENRFDTTDGPRWTLWTNRGLAFDEDGRATEVQSSGIDITDRRRAEDALRDAARRKDEFLAMLAHELRNPLAPLRTGLEVMKQPGASAEAVGRVRAVTERQLTNLVRLVDDLLDVSRISRGHIELRLARVELAGVIQHAIETVRPLIQRCRPRPDRQPSRRAAVPSRRRDAARSGVREPAPQRRGETRRPRRCVQRRPRREQHVRRATAAGGAGRGGVARRACRGVCPGCPPHPGRRRQRGRRHEPRHAAGHHGPRCPHDLRRRVRAQGGGAVPAARRAARPGHAGARWLRRGPPHSAGVMGPRRDARGADRLGAGGAQTPIGAGRLRSAPRQARRSQSTRGAAGVLTHAAAVAAVLTRASMVEAMRDASLATPWIIVDDIAWRK